MQWWTDLWLNEGFASWVQYLSVDHSYPDWDVWISFVYRHQKLALELDGLGTPIYP